jgi:membrane-associated protease RseP (regulator of RpoE activity)
MESFQLELLKERSISRLRKTIENDFQSKHGCKQVGGFKAIFDIFPNTWSWETFWRITALLSIMLGVMNLLPIPALDGGHVCFYYMKLSGKKPSDKF